MTSKIASEDKTETNVPDVGGVTKTDWIPLDPDTDRGAHGLTPLLLHRLGHTVAGTEVTIAQMVAQRLLDRALDGHFAALEEILIRIDGDAKTRDPATRSEKTPPELDDVKAQRILDAMYEPGEGPPGD